jgi:hypothetical protein
MRTSRDRFAVKEGGRNAIIDSLMGQGARKKKMEEFRRQYQQNEDQKFLPSDYGKEGIALADVKDNQMIGVQTLLVGDGQGGVNKKFSGEIEIGGVVHHISPDQEGEIRICNSEVIEAEIMPIIERNKYITSLVSLCLLDGSDRIAKMLLGKHFSELTSEGKDGRPSKLTNLSTRSREYSDGMTHLEGLLRKASPIVDSEKIYKYLNEGRLAGDSMVSATS